MNTTSFEPMLRGAVVKALDGISRKATDTERAAEGAIGRLLKRWNDLSTVEKENVAGIVVATAITAVGAIGAIKGRSKKVVKKAAKKAVRKLT